MNEKPNYQTFPAVPWKRNNTVSRNITLHRPHQRCIISHGLQGAKKSENIALTVIMSYPLESTKRVCFIQHSLRVSSVGWPSLSPFSWPMEKATTKGGGSLGLTVSRFLSILTSVNR